MIRMKWFRKKIFRMWWRLCIQSKFQKTNKVSLIFKATISKLVLSKDGAASLGEKKKKNVEIEEMKEAFMADPEYLESLAKDIMNDFDKDRSGELDFNEFKDLVDNLDLQFRLNINFWNGHLKIHWNKFSAEMLIFVYFISILL